MPKNGIQPTETHPSLTNNYKGQDLLLVILNNYPKGLTQKDLRTISGIGKASVSEFTKTLQADGYVSCASNKTDKRSVITTITEKGRIKAKAILSGTETLNVNRPKHNARLELDKSERSFVSNNISPEEAEIRRLVKEMVLEAYNNNYPLLIIFISRTAGFWYSGVFPEAYEDSPEEIQQIADRFNQFLSITPDAAALYKLQQFIPSQKLNRVPKQPEGDKTIIQIIDKIRKLSTVGGIPFYFIFRSPFKHKSLNKMYYIDGILAAELCEDFPELEHYYNDFDLKFGRLIMDYNKEEFL